MFQGIFKSAINDANKNYIFGTGSIPIQIKTANLETFANSSNKQQGYQVAEVNELISTMLTGWDKDGNKPKSMSDNYLELILSCDNGVVVKKRLQFPHIITWQDDSTPYNIADVYKPFAIDNWLKADDFENPDITLVVEPTDEILTTSTATPPEATTEQSGRFYLYYRNLPVGVNRVHIDFHIKTQTEPIDFDLEIADGLSWKDAQAIIASNEQAKINVLLGTAKDVYKYTGAEGNFEDITMYQWSALYQQIISLAPSNKFTHDLYFYIYDETLKSILNDNANSIKTLSQRYRPFFTVSDFPDENTALNDIGIAARITPNKQVIESNFYRYFWVSVKKGDTIHTNAMGYTDNINIGFAESMNVAEITNIYASVDGQIERYATAPNDGYFLINYILSLSTGKNIPAYVWFENTQAKVLKISSLDDYLFDGFIQVIANNPVVVSGGIFQKSLIYKVSANDKISVKVKQFNDTAAIAFTTEKPEIGVSAQILAVGVNGGRLVQVTGMAPNDGYVMITYRATQENPISDLLITSNVAANINTFNKEFRGILDIKKDIPDFRPMFNFTSAAMEAADEMANWTGSQIIENIYEPLRALYPNYIKRKSIGKCSDGLTDIWLYEFNNSIEEWFGINNRETFISNESNDVLLPGTNDMTMKQCAFRKTTFDDYFAQKEYANVYFLMDFPVRKLETWVSREDVTFFNDTYYKFTFADNLKITEYQGVNNGLELWWTKSAKTYDQHAMIISGIHADESAGYLGTALALKYIIENHTKNPTLNYIFNNVKLSVVPIVNMWGSNQTPKVRADYNGNQMNDWSIMNAEQTAISNYVATIKDELSFFADFHTSELWNNYGYVYAIPYPHVPIYPAIVAAANYLCRSWFPDKPAYNWNIGGVSTGLQTSAKYMDKTYGIPSVTVEFCGQDLMAFGQCERWSAKYMTYCVENFLNFIISLCAIRIKNNSNSIIENALFERIVMS